MLYLILDILGLAVGRDKCVPPAIIMLSLPIEINTAELSMRIPTYKSQQALRKFLHSVNSTAGSPGLRPQRDKCNLSLAPTPRQLRETWPPLRRPLESPPGRILPCDLGFRIFLGRELVVDRYGRVHARGRISSGALHARLHSSPGPSTPASMPGPPASSFTLEPRNLA